MYTNKGKVLNLDDFVVAVRKNVEYRVIGGIKDPYITNKMTKRVVAAFVKTVIEELAKGNSIKIIGFGTFTTKKTPVKTICNVQTNRIEKTRQYIRPIFKSSEAFNDALSSK